MVKYQVSSLGMNIDVEWHKATQNSAFPNIERHFDDQTDYAAVQASLLARNMFTSEQKMLSKFGMSKSHWNSKEWNINHAYSFYLGYYGINSNRTSDRGRESKVDFIACLPAIFALNTHVITCDSKTMVMYHQRH